jgi:copper chaperone
VGTIQIQNLKGNPQKTVDRISECMTTTITVEGMSCGHCEQTVEEALQGVNGITDATADHEAEQATIKGDANSSELVEAVEDAGYTASV